MAMSTEQRSKFAALRNVDVFKWVKISRVGRGPKQTIQTKVKHCIGIEAIYS